MPWRFPTPTVAILEQQEQLMAEMELPAIASGTSKAVFPLDVFVTN